MQTQYQHQQRRWPRYIVGFIVLISCLRAWTGPITFVEEARAQIPDSAMQRKLLLAEMKQVNQQLAQLRDILERRTLNVRIQGADNQTDKPAGSRRNDR